jgi:hypothetical protein
MIKAIVLIFFIFVSFQPVMAYNGGYTPGYEPYTPGGNVKPFPLVTFERQKNEHEDRDLFTSKGDFEITVDRSQSPPQVKITHRGIEKSVFTLADAVHPYLCEAFRGDLNGDGASDFICVFGGTGCGLASEYCHAVFAISFEGKYYVSTMHTMGFGREDVVDWSGRGTATIIHTWFIGGDAGKDGQRHNYWVYNFLETREGRLQLSDRLPWKWVLYTFKPNHRDSWQLTEQQKIRCWIRDTMELFFQ